MVKWNGIGEPECSNLAIACMVVEEALQERAYLVGSASESREFRDVDVRVMMEDKKFEELFGPTRIRRPFYSLFCVSVSTWLSKMTGLPVDFQVQTRSEMLDEDVKKIKHCLSITKLYPKWSKSDE